MQIVELFPRLVVVVVIAVCLLYLLFIYLLSILAVVFRRVCLRRAALVFIIEFNLERG